MAAQFEKKKKTIAALTTIGVNVLILLLMIFIGSWKMAGYGQGEYPGIEVNLGYDDQGSGEIEPETPIGEEKAKDKEESPKPAEEQQQENKISEPTAQETPAESKQAENTETFTDPNSDVEIKEKKKDEKPVEKVVEKKPLEKVEKPVEKKPVELPKIDEKAVYKGKSTNADAKKTGTNDGKQGKEGNQGDDIGKEGNKGVPGGTPGSQVYTGKPGGGDGGISMTGFNGFEKPVIQAPDLPDESYGVYEFSVKVDDEGYVVQVNVIQRGLSLEAERRLKAAIQKLRFPPIGSNLPEQSEGKIIFKVVSSKD